MSKAFASLLARRFAPLDFSSVPGFPHPVPNISEWGDFLPIFKESKEDNPAEHLLKFHECMDLLDLPHEDVRMKMFMFSLYGDARQWYFSLPPSSISSLKDFHKAFTKHCKRYFSDEFAFDNCCDEYELHCKFEDVNLERASPHNMSQPVNDLQDIVFSHQNELQMDYKETERSLSILKSDCYELEEMVSLATQRDDQRCLHKDQIASFQNSEYVKQADVSVEDSLKPAIDRKDSFQSFDCSTHDKQIESPTVESIGATIDVEGSPHLPDLQKNTDCSRHLQEGKQNGSDQKFSSYVSPAEIPQPAFNNVISKGSSQHLFNLQFEQQFKKVFLSDIYDPVDNYFQSMSSKCVKAFWSEEDCPYHLFPLLFCMIWSSLLLGSRSIIMTENQFLTWLHWKHAFT
jgi:hypothetical protein